MVSIDNIKNLWNLLVLYMQGALRGGWLLIKYWALMVWYFIFTPKDAEYQEDIPKLYQCHKDIRRFMIEYGVLVGMHKLKGK